MKFEFLELNIFNSERIKIACCFIYTVVGTNVWEFGEEEKFVFDIVAAKSFQPGNLELRPAPRGSNSGV